LKSTLNLKMQSTYLDESHFQSIGDDLTELGKKLAEEFYKTRMLGPVKVVIHGPPLAGKTKLSAKLSEYYGAVTIDPTNMLENMKKSLVDFKTITALFNTRSLTGSFQECRIQNAEEYLEYASKSKLMRLDDTVITFEMLERVATGIAKWRQDVELIENEKKQEEEVLIKLLVELIQSAPHSQNQGYILDGFPFKRNVAEQVFLLQSKVEDENLASNKFNELIKPGKHNNDTFDCFYILMDLFADMVIILNAAEVSLCNSAMNLQEEEAARTKNTEFEFLKKLENYRWVL
jgi:adenylate kinase